MPTTIVTSSVFRLTFFLLSYALWISFAADAGIPAVVEAPTLPAIQGDKDTFSGLPARLTSINKQDEEDESNTPSKRLKISIVTVGTRGDIQPFYAVALALRERGHDVRIVTSTVFAPMMEKQGLQVVEAYGDPNQEMQTNPEFLKRMEEGDSIGILRSLRDIFERNAPTVVQILTEEVEKNPPDLVITSYTGEYAGWFAALEYNIPYVTMALYSLHYNPNFMQFGFPKLPGGLHYYILRDGLLSFFYNAFRPFDEFSKAGILNKVTRLHFTQSVLQPVRPIIHLMSPLFAPILARNHPPEYMFAGNTVVDEKYQVNSDNFGGSESTKLLDTFISAADKPIYIGWGSLTTKNASFMTEIALRAAKFSNKRAIILGGYAGLSMKALEVANVEEEILEYARKHVLFVDSAPHEWLFSRVACTVHHGGIGTTISAMRAGIPMVITPIMWDNMDNSHLVREMEVGVGFEKNLADISFEEIGEAIVRVTSDKAMAGNAKSLSEELLKENGAKKAAILVEQFWEDWGATGKFFESFPGPEPVNYEYQVLMLFVFGAPLILFTRSLNSWLRVK